jgi:hypothetical protein
VVIVVGRANQAEDPSIIEAAIRHLAEALPGAKFLPAWRRANVAGALDMGLSPDLEPGRRVATVVGRTTPAQIEALATGQQKAVVLLEAACWATSSSATRPPTPCARRRSSP